MRISDAFKNEKGAFDLPSIMIGVAVVAILTVGVLAAIFGVIPWAQDNAAKQDASAVVTAQGVYHAQFGSDKASGERYASLTTLQGDPVNLLPDDLKTGRIDVTVNEAGQPDKFTVTVTSETGATFTATSDSPTPVKN